MSNITIIANELSDSELLTESSTTPRSLAISEHSLVQDVQAFIEGLRMSLPQDSHVSLSAMQENDSEPTTNEICGSLPSNAYAWYDHATHCWRTFQACLLVDILEPFSEIWPRQGMTANGVYYPQQNAERHTCESECGFLPTIGKNEYRGAGKKRYVGSAEFRGAKMSEGLRHQESDPIYLHPNFAEAAMMWPITWTALAPLGMDKYQLWLQQHGIYSVRE